MPSTTAGTIDDLVNMPIPEKLWHYTDFSGFCGIVKTRHIYATNIRYLNDREEFGHSIGIAREMLDEVVKKYSRIESLKEYLPEITMGLFEEGGRLSPQSLSVFTASFSLNGDQLSQWRGYSKGSSGVSLGFDLRGFRPPIDSDTLATFAPCVYDEQAKRRLMSEAIETFADRATELNKKINDHLSTLESIRQLQKSRPGLTFEEAKAEQFARLSEEHLRELKAESTFMAGKLLRLGGLLKHSAFEEENEWRFVLPLSTNRMPVQNPIKYLFRTSTLVPYIEFQISGRMGEAEVLPLTDVVIGPGAEFEAAIDAARGFLESEGIRHVTVRPSRIPYRPR